MTSGTSTTDPAAKRRSRDWFAGGPWPVEVRTIEAVDAARGRTLPCEVWHPARGGPCPLVVFSHASASHRRAASFFCTHLASHGYFVAAPDHSELVAPELRRPEGESAQARAARIDAVIASRVPDIRLVIDTLVDGRAGIAGIAADARSIGVAGHSFGGWAALAAGEADPRIRSVVAMAPGGSRRPRPGILPLLVESRRRDLSTLVLAAQDDLSTPLDGVMEVAAAMAGPTRALVLRSADHYHFMDKAEEIHESVRRERWEGELAWLAETRPFAELCPAAQSHAFARGLALVHFDATLRRDPQAQAYLAADIDADLARRGIDAWVA